MELQVTLFSGNTPSPVTLQKDRKTESTKRINKQKRQKQKSVKFKFSLKEKTDKGPKKKKKQEIKKRQQREKDDKEANKRKLELKPIEVIFIIARTKTQMHEALIKEATNKK